MAYIGTKPTIGNFQICDAISVVNGQAAYTMQVGGVNVSPQSSNHMIVSLNGTIQKPGGANPSFTVSGSTITFASNLATGDVIDFIQILGDVLDLGVPSDATVTTAKLADSSVTTAKLNDASVSLAKLTATGTKDATTFLRGDNTFSAPSVGLTKLASTTVSSAVANVEFDSTYVSDYSTYFLTISKFSAATDGYDLDVAFYNGSTKITLNHCHNWKNMDNGSQNIGLGGSSLNHHRVIQDGEASDDKTAGLVWIVLNNDKQTEGGGAYGFGSTLNQNGSYYGYDSESIFTADYLLNKIQILDGGGSNIDSGTFTLYGVTK